MSEPIETPNADAPEVEAETTAQEADQPKTYDEDYVRRLRAEAAKYRTQLKEAEPIVSQWKQLEEASKTELQRAQEQLANWQNRAETLQTSLVRSRVETLAATEFADPSDAVGALDPGKYLGLEGAIDDDAIRADLAGVLEKKPHWRKAPPAPSGPRTPAPNPAQGSGAGGSVPADPAQAFAAHIQGLLRG